MCFSDLVEKQEVERSSEDDDEDGVGDGSKSKENELEHYDKVDSDTTGTSIPAPRQ